MNITMTHGNEENETEGIPCEYCGAIRPPRYMPWNGKMRPFGYYDCECDKARFEREVEARERKKRDEAFNALMQNHGFKQSLKQVGLDERYAKAEHEGSEKLANEIKEKQSNVFIFGGIGAGKTYLACAILKKLFKEFTCKFVTMAEIMQDALNSNEADRGDLMERCKTYDVLLLDDLGKENMTEFAVSKVFEIVDDRYRKMKPTIFTSNFGLDELKSRFTVKGASAVTADAIISRIQQNCHVIKLTGGDKRIEDVAVPQNTQQDIFF